MVGVVRVNLRTVTRRFSSALYITGDKAQSNFVVLTPHVDFDELIKHKAELVKSIEARKLGIDLDKVEKRWSFYKMIDDHREVLEATRSEIYNKIGKLKQEDPENNRGDIEKLQLHVKLVKDELKNVKDYAYGIEENANLAVLSLPNLLHPKTPLEGASVFYQFLEQPGVIDKSHMEIGDLIEYTNPLFYFLKSEAAIFEFVLTNYFQERLLDRGFTQFSNADFARSIVVEGCGIDYSKIFTLEGSIDDLNRLHVVGGGSLCSFMAYFARHSVQASSLSLQFFSIGRKYTPVEKGGDLFSVSQNSVVQVFVATEDDTDKMDETLHFLAQDIIKMYEALGYHFRVVYVPASDLASGESLKMSFQMFSNFSQKYVEVGNLSVFGNYLSKRLLFTYGSNKDKKFVKVIAGEVLNIQSFLACALENNYFSNKKPLIRGVLQKYVE